MVQDPYPGLTIITLRTNTDSCLIDMDQNVVKTWHGDEVPTEFVYMLPDSSVLRPCRVPNAGGPTGGNVVWEWRHLAARQCHRLQ